MTNARLRNVVFTINNYTDLDIEQVEGLACKYLVYGYEIGEEEKTKHIQGYVEFPNALTMKSLKKKLPRAHLEKRKGSADQAAAYCKKDGNYKERGEISKQGKRNDLVRIMGLAKKRKLYHEVCEEEPQAYRYPQAYKQYLASTLSECPDWRKVSVDVYIGPTGTGKTRKAMMAKDVYKLDRGHKVWFDGYTGQKTLVIDDFYGWIPYGMLLNILHGHRLRIPIKGGQTYAHWDHVIITSNQDPVDWYETIQNKDALMRRIDRIVDFDGIPIEDTIEPMRIKWNEL